MLLTALGKKAGHHVSGLISTPGAPNSTDGGGRKWLTLLIKGDLVKLLFFKKGLQTQNLSALLGLLDIYQ